MSLNATQVVQVQLTGQGFSGVPFFQQQSGANTNAPPPTSWTLTSGNNPFTVPAGFTVGTVILQPPPGSVVTKTLKGVNGDTGVGAAHWTTQTIVIPAAAGDALVINASGAEVLEVIFA